MQLSTTIIYFSFLIIHFGWQYGARDLLLHPLHHIFKSPASQILLLRKDPIISLLLQIFKRDLSLKSQTMIRFSKILKSAIKHQRFQYERKHFSLRFSKISKSAIKSKRFQYNSRIFHRLVPRPSNLSYVNPILAL